MQRMGPRGFLTDQEKQNLPKVTWPLIRRILSYLTPYWVRFVLVFATILLSSVLGLLPSIITGRIVDEALVGESMKLLLQLILAALATMIASQLVTVLTSYLNAWISQHIIFDMKNQMYAHLQQMSHAFFTTERQGDVITRMNSDISGVSNVISGTLQSILSNVATVVTTLVALFGMNWKMAIIGVLVIPLLVLPTRSAGRQRWKLLSDGQAKHDEMNQLINETLSVSGSMLTKLFTREKAEYDRFVKVNGEVTKLALKESLSGRWFRLTMGIFTQLGPLLIYFAGGYLIIVSGETGLTVGMITAMVALVNRLYRPVESLLNIQVDFTRSMALFTRIFDYFDRPIDIKSHENGKKPDLTGAEIRFEHVRFGYTEDKEILHDVNFTVRSGEMAAIVGGSGSGKSTVINFIPRLWDVKGGRVLVGGVDVRDFDLHWLRSQIGMVSQDTYLFNGTIRENLRYAKEDATDEELIAACKAAAIHDFIIAQPNGYDTEVGNRGLKLSGGEKQRLSIARVILKDPKILILDEATSALDARTEAAVVRSITDRGITCIVVAHRLSTVRGCSEIIVLDHGSVVERGTHEELIARRGRYLELVENE